MREAMHNDWVAGAEAPHERVKERMNSELQKTGREPQRMSGRTRRLVLTLMAAGIPLVGCEGDNMFTGDSVELLPQVTSVSVPQVAFAGETVNVRVDATASFGISDVVVALRGAVVKDTLVEVDPPRTRVSQVLSIPVPTLLQDTLLIIEAQVIDLYGNSSRARQGQVVVFGPPTITNVSAPTVARPGEPISVRVTAFGSRKISLVDMVARGAIDKDSTVAVQPPRNNVTQDLVLMLPVNAGDTLLTLAVGVRDEAGQASEPTTKIVPLAIEPPTVDLTAPATAQAGMNLEVDVHAAAVRQIEEVRLELRGAHVEDKTIKVNPTQSDLTMHIAVPIPGNVTESELRVRALAVDRGGAVAYSDVKTVTIPLGSPIVTDVEVPTSTKFNSTVDIRVRARGDRPLARVDVRFRGAVDFDGVYMQNPQNTNVIQDASVTIPAVPKDSVLVVSATATDVSGAVSEIVSKVIPVTLPTTDTTSAVAAVQTERPLLYTAASPSVWTIAGPPAEAGIFALPARRTGLYTAGRRRRG